MKKTIITALMVAITSFAAFSQTDPEKPMRMERGAQEAKKTPDEKAKEMADKMNAVVTLSSDQYQRVLEVGKAFAMKHEALKIDGTPDSKDKLQALKDDKRAQLKTILTAEQLQKWDDYKKTEHRDHKDKRPMNP